MPKTLCEIEAHAAQLENSDYYGAATERPVASIQALRQAAIAAAEAQVAVAAAVSQARTDGHSWETIGGLLGTSGENARQRFGRAKAPSVS